MSVKHLSIVGLLLFASCRPQQLIREHFTAYKKFDGNTQGLRIDGIYVSDSKNCDTCLKCFNCLVLYQNGFVSWSGPLCMREFAMPDSVLNSLALSFKKRSLLYFHGAFTIDSNRRIILQNWIFSRKGTFAAKYDVWEYRGHIINDSTFTLTSSGLVNGHQYKHNSLSQSTFHYYPLTSKPDSSNWMMLDSRLNKRK